MPTSKFGQRAKWIREFHTDVSTSLGVQMSDKTRTCLNFSDRVKNNLIVGCKISDHFFALFFGHISLISVSGQSAVPCRVNSRKKARSKVQYFCFYYIKPCSSLSIGVSIRFYKFNNCWINTSRSGALTLGSPWLIVPLSQVITLS